MIYCSFWYFIVFDFEGVELDFEISVSVSDRVDVMIMKIIPVDYFLSNFVFLP